MVCWLMRLVTREHGKPEQEEVEMTKRDVVWLLIAAIVFVLWLALVAPSAVPVFLR